MKAITFINEGWLLQRKEASAQNCVGRNVKGEEKLYYGLSLLLFGLGTRREGRSVGIVVGRWGIKSKKQQTAIGIGG